MWDGGDKLKSQRDLAKGAKLGVKDDVKILDYYRFNFCINVLTSVLSDYWYSLRSHLYEKLKEQGNSSLFLTCFKPP